MRRTLAALPLLAASLLAQPFVNYESSLVHPIRVSADGTRLFVVNAPEGRLSVYDLRDPASPLLLGDIVVGQEPVSVTQRTSDELWVANSLSDSVSVVSLSQGRVIDTLRVADEPHDVAFAGGRAFVTASASDQVHVFDAVTRAPVGAPIAIVGKDPRAMAVNAAGTKVYVAVHRSGNRTTVIPSDRAPAPPPPTNPNLPQAPRQGIIVDATDPLWSSVIRYTVPDVDVVEIDAGSLATRGVSRVGTILFDLVVHPSTGDLWVAETDARNLVRFEPNVRAHVIDSRVARVTTGATPVVTAFDLNPGIDYQTLPNPAAKAIALAEPTGIALDPAANLLYVAAQGTDRVGVVTTAGAVQARIEIGSTPGSQVDTRQKRGPRALVLHPSAPRLYVLNRLSMTLSVVDTVARSVLRELALSGDPTPANVRDGRKFLYDAKLSGNGTMSCASCHVDGDLDGIAWDLGDPGGNTDPAPSQPFPFNLLPLTPFHPMKGPMTTQTLRGLGGIAPLHWRGDRVDLAAFNRAFPGVMGGALLAQADLNLFTEFMRSAAFPPNPNQNRDRTFSAAAADGKNFFETFSVVQGFPFPVTCATCHSMPTGTGNMVITAQILQAPQQMKVPHLRNLYRKTGMNTGVGQVSKAGFGFVHDGDIDTLTTFLNLPVFNPWTASRKPNLVTFLLAFDTGTAPAVGYQVTVNQGNAGSAPVASDLTLLQGQAAAGNCDLVAKGVIDGAARGLLYQPGASSFIADRTDVGPWTWTDLRTLALAGRAALTFTGVAPGTGTRTGIDRDLDGARDGADGLESYGASTPGCAGPLELRGNSKPRIGNAGFALVGTAAPAGGGGLLGLSSAPASLPVAGITLLVSPAGLVTIPIAADAAGVAVLPIALPPEPLLVGVVLYAQTAFGSLCGLSASQGLRLAIRP